MEFIIKDPNPTKSSIEKSNISIKLMQKKIYRPIWIRYLIGFLALGVGLISKDVYIMTSIGIAMILLSTIALIQYWRQMNKYRSLTNSLADAREKYLGAAEMFVNEEGVISTNALVRSEIKWRGFLTYTYYQPFLFLDTGHELGSGFIIDSRLMDQSGFAELLGFVRTKLREKNAKE